MHILFICLFCAYNLHICYVEIYVMAYFVQILASWHANAYEMHIPVLQVPCTDRFRAVPNFRFRSERNRFSSLPVNTLICQGPATVAPALVGWRWGWQLRDRRPLACRPPGPPSASIGSNPPGLQPLGRCRPGRCGSTSRCRHQPQS